MPALVQLSTVDTIGTVGAPAPNRVGHVFPQVVQVEIAIDPFSGSVAP